MEKEKAIEKLKNLIDLIENDKMDMFMFVENMPSKLTSKINSEINSDINKIEIRYQIKQPIIYNHTLDEKAYKALEVYDKDGNVIRNPMDQPLPLKKRK